MPQHTKVVPIEFDSNWKVLGFGDNKRSTFTLRDETLSVESNDAVAFYYRKLPVLSQKSHCDWQLEFSWRVLSAQGMSAQATLERDDRPLAVHIWANEPSRLGWFKGTLARLFSVPAPGHILTYSWGLDNERGQRFPNPHLVQEGRITVLRSQREIGETWHAESINFISSLRQLMSGKLKLNRLYVVVSADTEDNDGSSVSEIKDLRLVSANCHEL